MTNARRLMHAFCWVALVAGASAQTREAVRGWRMQHEAEILRQYAELLSIPNVAADTANIEKNAEQIASLLRARGAEARVLPVAGAPPIVYGELRAPGATRTLIFYAHYDGQPVDPAQWASPPWQPRLLGGALEQNPKELPLATLSGPVSGEARIYARSASDDKAPIQAMLSALDALAAARRKPGINLKFFFEGEEEAGSSHFAAALRQYAGLLKGDAWVLCDGPVHQSRRLQLYFGARGITDVEITLYGPARVLHSGHYGNWAPNPAAQLASLLASMRDRNGHVTIPGFNADVRPLTAAEVAALRAAPEVDPQLRRELALAWTEPEGEPLHMAITHPAMNVRGIEAGNVGSKAQNAIMTEARASIDFRLVPDQRPERVKALVEQYLRSQGFWITSRTPTLEERRLHARPIKLEWGHGYPAARTSLDLPVARAIAAAMDSVSGQPVVRMPLLGGSVPMYLFTDVMKTPVIGLPIANHDNNQHGANENLRVQNLWDGIEIFAAIFAELDRHWPK